MLSRASIDSLGDRLREGLTVEDLTLLDQYRRSFREDYDLIVPSIRDALQMDVSGRPAKSTTAITEKLRRGSMRLTQMQDISGCRLIAKDIADQDRIVSILAQLWPDSSIVDRRKNPSHGYRAVHVIPRPNQKPIEIQVRTELQHLWAEFSEKLADKFGANVKYGQGEKIALDSLEKLTFAISSMESIETEIDDSTAVETLERFNQLRMQLKELLTTTISKVKK